jgi:hypothetical protein
VVNTACSTETLTETLASEKFLEALWWRVDEHSSTSLHRTQWPQDADARWLKLSDLACAKHVHLQALNLLHVFGCVTAVVVLVAAVAAVVHTDAVEFDLLLL